MTADPVDAPPLPSALPAPQDPSGSTSQLRRVAAVLADIGAAPTLEAALAALGRGAITLLGGAQAAVRVYDADGNGANLAFWVSADGTLSPADAATPPPASVAGRLLAGGPPSVIPDLQALDPADSPLYAQLRERGLRSSVAVPIVAAGARVGSLHVDHPDPGHFTDLHLALAEALAIQAGAAVERARQLARRGVEAQLRAMYQDAREQTETHVALNASLRDLAGDNARLLEDARAALRARDDFLTAAAHELKTPMTTILGLAQLAQRKLRTRGAISPEDLTRYVNSIAIQTARLSRVVDHLLEGARLQDATLTLFRRQVDLAGLAREAVDLLMVDPTEHPITLRLPAQPVLLHLDYQLVRQVILTLLDNAVRFSRPAPPGGSPRPPILLTLRERPDAVVLTVRDHGLGIPPEHLPVLFQPFNRAHASLQRSGVGLGLAIARQVVELHQGVITASTPRSGGTLVTITLPATPAGADAAGPADLSDGQLS